MVYFSSVNERTFGRVKRRFDSFRYYYYNTVSDDGTTHEGCTPATDNGHDGVRRRTGRFNMHKETSSKIFHTYTHWSRDAQPAVDIISSVRAERRIQRHAATGESIRINKNYYENTEYILLFTSLLSAFQK